MALLLHGDDMVKREVGSSNDVDGVKVHRMLYEAAEDGGWRGEAYATTTTTRFMACRKDESLTHLRAAVGHAREASSDPAKVSHRKVAGSLPPLSSSAADGSLTYREIAGVLASEGVDVLIASGLTTVEEGRAAARAAMEVRKKLWIYYTMADDDELRLRSGDDVATAVAGAVAAGHGIVEGVGIHVGIHGRFVETVTATIDAVVNGAAVGTVTHIIASADAGGSTSRDVDHAAEWIRRGVTVVGGCGPAHIHAVARRISSKAFIPRLPALVKDLLDVGGIFGLPDLASFGSTGLVDVRRFAEDSGADYCSSPRLFWWSRWPADVPQGTIITSPTDVQTHVNHAVGVFRNNNNLDHTVADRIDQAATHIAQWFLAKATKLNSPVFSHDISSATLLRVAAEQIYTLAILHLPKVLLRRIHAYIRHDLSSFHGHLFHYKTTGGTPLGARKGCGIITDDGLALGVEALLLRRSSPDLRRSIILLSDLPRGHGGPYRG